MVTIQDIINDFENFVGKSVEYELLSGGYVNQTYKVKCEGNSYCIRINNEQQKPYLSLDTEKEAAACQQASLLSISPPVYNIHNAKQYLITEFFSGKCLSGEDVRNPEIIRKYIKAIKLIHEQVKVDRDFSIFDQLNIFINVAEKSGLELPTGLFKVMEHIEKIKESRSGSNILNKVFCHNDIWQNNILYDGKRICIIDWEYCGYGDGFFDFAHIANINNMIFEEEKLMLTTYFGFFEPEMWQILQQMKYISSAYDAIWYLFHSSVSNDENQKIKYINQGHILVNNLAER